MASGRISKRSKARLGLVPGLVRRVLQTAAAVAARTDEDAGRFLALGARPEVVRVTGDLKDDRAPSPWVPPPSDRPRWIAACTRPGEEEEVLTAMRAIAETNSAGELLLAPRHPERFAEVGELLGRAAIPWRTWERRDDPPIAPSEWEVVLVDEMGVLDEAYRRATCAFVGGSLRPFGGHSPLEAAAAGRAVLAGPHTETCEAAVTRLEAASALQRVHDGAQLGACVTELLTDAERAHRIGRAAHGVAGRRNGNRQADARAAS